ncbi:anthranilate synthase component I [Caproicibacter sp. BJN0012]|uniref:anthranilate synthase component I n=1 Tax=Caproicibacter sp. BJN0012 TaxID=3110227 RepID=UPI002E15AA5E
MLNPPLETVKGLLSGYQMVPVAASRLMDRSTPVGIFSTLKAFCEDCFLLESVERSEQWGRYSFLGIHPKSKITIRGGIAEFEENGSVRSERVEDPAGYLAKIVREYGSPRLPGFPRFTGGLVGYFGYDLLRYLEKKLGSAPEDDLGLPDCELALYDEVIAFDHLSSRVFVILNVRRGGNTAAQYEACEARAREILRELEMGKAKEPAVPGYDPGKIEVCSNLSKERFCAMVKEAKGYIRAGDIFQVVLSRRFEIENPPDPFKVYRVLRAANPSPYLYYIRSDGYCIVGASPEMLVNVTDGVVTNKPIAGTSRRSADEAEDERLERELLADEKERAEHTMLVDLGRNDVGRVCRYGTVEVKDFMHVEHASKVMHLVSEVTGVLREDKTAEDALLSVLPAGTLSGAPKIRAMQIIDGLEDKKRGVYGGAIGYLGFDGNIDTCIAIRTALFRNGKAYVQAGAGIVADSVPEKEYEETENKALAVLGAIQEAKRL